MTRQIDEKNATPDVQDRAYGALIGGAIGDAMGMPASFFTRDRIKEVYGYIDDFLDPDTDAQTWHADLKAGEITDDTMEGLIVARVLIDSGHFDRDVFIEQMRRWAVEQNMLETTVIGPSTRRFLTAIVEHRDPAETSKESTTNGSAMRVAPVGIKYYDDMRQCLQAAAESSLPSHGSRPCVAAACAVAAAVAAGVRGGSTPEAVMQLAYEGAVYGESIGHDIPAASVSKRILLAKEIVDRNRSQDMNGLLDELVGYLGAGMQANESIPFSLGVFYAIRGAAADGILAAVNGGDDADTNGSICGNICGAFSGASALPDRWKSRIVAANSVDFQSLANQLIRL